MNNTLFYSIVSLAVLGGIHAILGNTAMTIWVCSIMIVNLLLDRRR